MQRCEKEKNVYAANTDYAARADDSDKKLILFARAVENILIDMDVPAVKYLDLIEKH